VDRSTIRSTSSRTHSARDDRGFTILESLTASAILLVVAAGVVMVMITTSGWYANARLRTQAYSVANQVMSTILSRNYSDIRWATEGEGFPEGILASMDWPKDGQKQFTVLTSWETTTDVKTGLEMKRIAVSALPVSRSLDPTATIVRFASGWQQTSSDAQKYQVPVEVTLRRLYNNEPQPGAGARVQLLDTTTLAEAYFATSNSSGVARFPKVLEGQYYLTSDPRFGTDLRPVHFPELVTIGAGGSRNNPILSVVPLQLTVTKNPLQALLRVGAYETEGWTVTENMGGVKEATRPEVPYKCVPGMVIYASPVLNAGATARAAYSGMGDATPFPDESKLGVYSAVVNAYGVAAIEIPWTVDSGAQQYWRIWCRTKNGGVVTVHTITTARSGGWEPGVLRARIERPEGAFDSASDLDYLSIVQFTRLGEGVQAENSAVMPDFP
jgi:prepilin-type N-terminal cleavage/methylation domain-containing protein